MSKHLFPAGFMEPQTAYYSKQTHPSRLPNRAVNKCPTCSMSVDLTKLTKKRRCNCSKCLLARQLQAETVHPNNCACDTCLTRNLHSMGRCFSPVVCGMIFWLQASTGQFTKYNIFHNALFFPGILSQWEHCNIIPTEQFWKCQYKSTRWEWCSILFYSNYEWLIPNLHWTTQQMSWIWKSVTKRVLKPIVFVLSKPYSWILGSTVYFFL